MDGYLGYEPRKDGSNPSRGTTPLPRDFGGDAPNVARRGSTPREGTVTLFWDRLTVGRELLELAIVVRLHGPELMRPVSSLGERRSYKAHQVGSIPSRGTANVCTATWVRGRA